MIRSLFVVLSSATVLSLAACSGAPSEVSDTGGEELSAGICGGFAGLTCASDHVCVMPAGPTHPDEAGKCKKGHHLTGTWNGDSASLVTSADGSAHLQFPCAFANIEPFFYLPNHEFSATGTYGGGPVVMHSAPTTFSGIVVGDHLSLTVTPDGSDAFTLELDKGTTQTHFALCR